MFCGAPSPTSTHTHTHSFSILASSAWVFTMRKKQVASIGNVPPPFRLLGSHPNTPKRSNEKTPAPREWARVNSRKGVNVEMSAVFGFEILHEGSPPSKPNVLAHGIFFTVGFTPSNEVFVMFDVEVICVLGIFREDPFGSLEVTVLKIRGIRKQVCHRVTT